MLSGFSRDMAWLESGPWRQGHINVPGSFENGVVLHPETNRSVTTIVVDAYGHVPPSTLEWFAHAYLSAPVQHGIKVTTHSTGHNSDERLHTHMPFLRQPVS